MSKIRNYKFRLYPTDSQEYKLQNNLAVCRWVYNRFVDFAKSGFVSRNDCNYYLTELKQQESWLYSYHSKMLQMVSTQLEGAEKALIELNKKGHKTGKVSRRKKGSNNRLKSILKMQKIHEKIANRRKDFQHKLSTQYAKNNDVIFVEKLEKLNMVKNHRLAQSIMDASWGTFIQKLEYKCKILIEVSARNTTIDCSRCGNKVPKSLAVRIHRCNVCNLVLDRDHNASINILKKGLNMLARADCTLPQELREVTLVEMPLVSRKQEEATQLVG